VVVEGGLDEVVVGVVARAQAYGLASLEEAFVEVEGVEG